MIKKPFIDNSTDSDLGLSDNEQFYAFWIKSIIRDRLKEIHEHHTGKATTRTQNSSTFSEEEYPFATFFKHAEQSAFQADKKRRTKIRDKFKLKLNLDPSYQLDSFTEDSSEEELETGFVGQLARERQNQILSLNANLDDVCCIL